MTLHYLIATHVRSDPLPYVLQLLGKWYINISLLVQITVIFVLLQCHVNVITLQCMILCEKLPLQFGLFNFRSTHITDSFSSRYSSSVIIPDDLSWLSLFSCL